MLTTVFVDLNGKDTLSVYSEDDVEEVIEHNRRLQSVPQKSDWGRHVASIPTIVLTRWLNDEWNRGNTSLKMSGREWDLLIERKLNDPDWRYLRTDK